MIVRAECDDALDALRTAQHRLGVAVDALNELPAHASTVRAFREAHDAAGWCVETVAAAIDTASRRAREAIRMEAVEERHVEAQTFPWAELNE